MKLKSRKINDFTIIMIKTDTKKISCIIPTFNGELSIQNTLNKIIGAGNIIHEIIVIDDGSTDRTKYIIEKFTNVKLVVNKKN